MRRLALVLAALVALAIPVAAGAHATLKSVSPGFQQELASAPPAIVLTFDQIVSFPSIEVLDQKGHNWALPATIDDTIVKAAIRQLPRGNYTVRWHALSADSHVVSGVWTFGVGVPALPPTEAYGASGPTRTEHIVRWLYFGALATVIGALGVRLLCLRGLVVPPGVEKRILLIAGLGTAAFLELGILAFCMRCEDVLQLPFGKFLYGDLSPISGGTRFGTAFIAMTLGFAVVAAVLAVERHREDAREGRLARAARTAEQVGVRHAVARDGVAQRGRDVRLHGDVGETLGAVLPCEGERHCL